MDNYSAPSILRDTTPGQKTPQWITLNSSNQRYFSGLDAQIHFGDIYIGQLLSLDYQLQEMVMPLFAYGDYTMRRAVHGMRMVKGSFTILFQQVHLMHQILNYLTGNETPETSAPKEPRTKQNLQNDPQNTLRNYVHNALAELAVGGVEQFGDFNGTSKIKMLADGVSRDYPLESKVMKEQLKNMQDLQRLQWTQKSGSEQVEYKPNGLLANLESRLTPLYSRFETLPQGFDINIILGRPPNGDIIQEFASGVPIPRSYSDAAKGSADVFKDKDPTNRIERALQASPPWTTRQIKGVRITGMSQSLDDSGRPLLEQYSFMGADLI